MDNTTFKLILSEQNINAEETIFIDDSQHNVNIARSYGINGVCLQRQKT